MNLAVVAATLNLYSKRSSFNELDYEHWGFWLCRVATVLSAAGWVSRGRIAAGHVARDGVDAAIAADAQGPRRPGKQRRQSDADGQLQTAEAGLQRGRRTIASG
jgi:hypothetical protein